MLARLEEPLRPTAAVKTAEAIIGRASLQSLLKLSRGIDAFTTCTGKWLAWLILVAVMVSAANAIVRKVFDTSSNSWLELAMGAVRVVFLLCAPWTLLANEHIRIDIVNNMLPKRVRDSIDVIGHVLFPVAADDHHDHDRRSVLLCARSRINEQSINAGGLPQWPAKSLISIGFTFLAGARHFRTDQAHRRHARPDSGSARIAGECASRPRSSTSPRRSRKH